MPLAVLAAGILWGSVTIGPLTPVCRVGTPCDGPAKQAQLTFSRKYTFANGVQSKQVAVKTNAAGRYRLTLTPGTWTVRASVGMRMTPTTVVVRAGTHRTNFSIDTGIR
jgi:hypothetical protein